MQADVSFAGSTQGQRRGMQPVRAWAYLAQAEVAGPGLTRRAHLAPS